MDQGRYSWCGIDPARLPDLPPVPAAPEVPGPVGFGSLPAVPDPAEGDAEPLVHLEHPRIKVVEAYRRSGLPFTAPGGRLRREVADRLGSAADLLPPGFGLAVWDAWRDQRLQRVLHDQAYADPDLPPGFVEAPSVDPASPPPHSTGGTVDLTLTWKSIPLALGTDFDEFVPLARPAALEPVPDDDPLAVSRDLRRLLRSVMVDRGFVQLDCEWWHFEFGTRLWAAHLHRAPRYHAHPGPVGP